MKISFHGSKMFFVMGMIIIYISFWGIIHYYSRYCKQRVSDLFNENMYLDKEIELQNNNAINGNHKRMEIEEENLK